MSDTIIKRILLWLARLHPKNQTEENITYPQLWYCWPNWMKRKWGPFGGPKQQGVHRIFTGTCGLLTGHEWSLTEIGYGGCNKVNRWCRWCDKIVTMPLTESPLPKSLKDILKNNKQ